MSAANAGLLDRVGWFRNRPDEGGSGEERQRDGSAYGSSEPDLARLEISISHHASFDPALLSSASTLLYHHVSEIGFISPHGDPS